MPGDDRRGSDDHQGRSPVRPCPTQADPKQPIKPPNGGLRSGAPVDSQLLLQREVLQNESAVSTRDGQPSNNVDEPGDHWCSITGSAHVTEAVQNWAPLGCGEPQPESYRRETMLE